MPASWCWSELRLEVNWNQLLDGGISSRENLVAILFAIVFPTIVTLAYFVVLAGQPSALQQGSYAVGKVIQFGFPAFWVFVILRERLSCACPNRRGVGIGVAFGLVVAVAMLGLALLWLKPIGFFDQPSDAIRAKIKDLGLDSVPKYAAASIFYALCHSLMEEYYWRWFVFRRLRFGLTERSDHRLEYRLYGPSCNLACRVLWLDFASDISILRQRCRWWCGVGMDLSK